MSEDLIHHAADKAGILPAYHDLSGMEHFAPVEAKTVALQAMGLDTNHDALADWLSRQAEDEAKRSLPRNLVVTANHKTSISLRHNDRSQFVLTGEDGTEQPLHAVDGEVTLPPLLTGYYRLLCDDGECTIFATPERAPSVEDVSGHERLWGVTAALYGLRSNRNIGIGDFEDLANLAEVLGAHGAGFLGFNPTHALGASPDTISPYSPSHRRFANSRHIAIDHVPELAWSETAQSILASQADSIAAARDATFVNHSAAFYALQSVLQALFQTLETDPRAVSRKAAFDAYLIEGGEELRLFATFEELSLRHGPDWRFWPEEFQQPTSPSVQSFAASHEHAIRFHAYLQWVTRAQMTDAHRRARRAGMGLGLYTDLAVGVVPGGAETWSQPGVFARGVSLGAPPDQFNADGQCWSLAPFNPLHLLQKSFAPFIDTIREALRGAGMMRIDHVLGLQRAFWVPDADGLPGCYIRYPRDILLAIVKIEATRAAAVVVGEDLGVVPDGLRAELERSNLYGCSVMPFERNDDGSLRMTAQYRRQSIACIGTHDTPTLAGYWRGNDISARVNAGQISTDDAHHSFGERMHERHRFRQLAGAHASDNEHEMPPLDHETNLALHGTLANSAAALVAVQLEDILRQEAQPNMPGTTHEYPNWQMKYDTSVLDLASDARLGDMAVTMARTRNRIGAQPN